MGCQEPQPGDPVTKPASEPAAKERSRQLDGSAQTPTKRVRSQLLYVPSYSHIYLQDLERTINLTATLSIRNTSPDYSITVTRADYYDNDGNHVESYLSDERTLGPLASTAYVVELGDLRGGVGANFLVGWQSEEAVPPPVVEAVMITGASSQGISFLTSARVLYEEPAAGSAASSTEGN
jgi:hypothetical protein